VGLKSRDVDSPDRSKPLVQTYPRGLKFRRSPWGPIVVDRFRRTLVGLKFPTIPKAPTPTSRRFRRTLVGLKRPRRTLVGLKVFQTYPRGVEVRPRKVSSPSSRRDRLRFQTYPRGVEVSSGPSKPRQISFRRTLVGLKLEVNKRTFSNARSRFRRTLVGLKSRPAWTRVDTPPFVSDVPSWV